MTTKSPWGRERKDLAEAPTVADFREVGLSESDAKAAAEGLAAGAYLSFEDACLSRAIFGGSRTVTLDEAKMRAKARALAGARPDTGMALADIDEALRPGPETLAGSSAWRAIDKALGLDEGA